ncbi:MAG: helix-turn-helix transcriptional regulator [Halofilum sp. (in: g-proteobacteria)]|nr:helix-turn-helix transcriptional regulator [Halofilum sp. (in: g-proteobacteria)]
MPHLAEALRINREWTVTAAGSGQEGTALVDGAGRILASRPPFEELLREEWHVLPQGRVPEVLVLAGSAGRTWRGRRIQVECRAFGEQLLLRVRPASPLDILAPRAREAAELFGGGLSYKEVARRMGISPDTARKHVACVYEQLGVRSKAALAALVAEESGR